MAQILISNRAMSRGGEAKWARISAWARNPKFNATCIGWLEIKTTNLYSIPITLPV